MYSSINYLLNFGSGGLQDDVASNLPCTCSNTETFFKAFKSNTNNTFEHEQLMIQLNSDLINIQLAFE